VRTVAALVFFAVFVFPLGASSGSARLQGHIAFSAGPLEPGRSNIYVYDLGKRKLARVTHGRGVEFDPTLSPDGRRVAWRSIRNGNEEIRVANIDGSGARNLTRHPSVDYAPAWSPDGRRIAFASTRGGAGELPHIWVMNAGGSEPHIVTRVFTGEYPSWSPDGKRIVFATNEPVRQDGFDLVVVGADGSKPHRITKNDLYEMGPSWSRDGRRIAFYAGNGGRTDVYVIGPGGRSRHRVTRGRGEMPSWSPSGRFLVYAAPSGLVVVRPDGSRVTALPTPAATATFPSWAR
jgi:Tol biopolymer transport system component